MMIDDIIAELMDTWGWTIEEANDAKLAIANYALCALLDTQIAEEALKASEAICST